MPTRNQIFISYAHADAAVRDEFIEMLQPAIARGSISLWSDEDIPVGDDWSKNITAALNSAAAGLLLVTPAFLKSTYITDVELKRLFSLAKTAGTAIYWVPLAPTLYTETPLADIQAAWKPDRPLDQLTAAERHVAIQQICLQIVEEFGFLPKVTGGRRQRLPQDVQERLGEKYVVGEEVGTGKFSIVYKAQQKNPSRTVGIKVLVASEFDDWARQRFTEASSRAAELTSPAFISIIESLMDEAPEFLIMEFVQGEPFSKYLLRYPDGVPLRAARRILLDLASAIEEVHQRGWTRGEMCSSNILIDRSGAARLSAVDSSTVLSEESQMAGNFLVDRESLAYMTPERFFGQPPTQLTDQFSLGLIATELLGGERVPRISAPADLEGKRRFFADLESARGRWAKRSREFAGIVSRMLRVDPDERWGSMRDVRHYLRDIEVSETDVERSQKTARLSYLRLQTAGTERAVFESFYKNLFAACPDVAQHFAAIDMERQYKILNGAIQRLLDFDPDRSSEMLRDLADQHTPLGLSRRHYDQFLEGLLEALAQCGVDAADVAAWRTTLAPAIDFMCTCQGLSATPPAV